MNMPISIRKSLRHFDEMRVVSIEVGVAGYAEGSCLIKFGNTHVLCTATVENQVPSFLKNTKQGWVTAEYSMLPRATHTRTPREIVKGKLGGRTHEIQRLIGRSLRSVIDLRALGEKQIILDCDVLQADGGTRTASITGAYVALCIAIRHMMMRGVIKKDPIKSQVAAISCGIINDAVALDLDYEEDKNAQIDANFVMTDVGDIVELQSTGEQRPFTKKELDIMLEFATKGINHLMVLQRQAIKNAVSH
jgi:ribonuclease PH